MEIKFMHAFAPAVLCSQNAETTLPIGCGAKKMKEFTRGACEWSRGPYFQDALRDFGSKVSRIEDQSGQFFGAENFVESICQQDFVRPVIDLSERGEGDVVSVSHLQAV